MYRGKTIALLMPARNEALSLRNVLKDLPPEMDKVLVVDNGSKDATTKVARDSGARVVTESRPGYGSACLAGIADMQNDPPDIVAFADADGSDDLFSLFELLDPVVNGHADLVLGKRVPIEPGALSKQQHFGNWLATRLIHLIWGYKYNDLGPMRVITWKSLNILKMSDPDYGWTVEMQIKALKAGLRIEELPVPYKKRSAGRSKVSRTLLGAVRAGVKTLWVIGCEAMHGRKFSYSKK